MKNTTRSFLLLAFGSILGWLPAPASALTSTWITSGSGDWVNSNNWTSGSPGLSGDTNPYDTAVFGSQGGGIVTLNDTATLGALTFSNSSSYTLEGSGTLNMYSTYVTGPQIYVNSGSLTVDVAISGDTTSWDGFGTNPSDYSISAVDLSVTTAANTHFTFNGSLPTASSYGGSFNIFGSGNAVFSSPLPNASVYWDSSGSVTFTNCGVGASSDGTGNVYLASSNAVTGITLDLYGDYLGANNHSTAYALVNNSITQYVEVDNTGILNLGVTTNTIGTLTLLGGTISGTGVLNLSSNITANQSATLSSGKITVNLNGNEGVVQEGIPGYAPYNPNNPNAPITEQTTPGGVTTLSGHNGYTGSTIIASGTLLINGTNSGGGVIQIDPAAADDGQIDNQNGFYVTPSNNTATLGGTGVATNSSVFVTNGGTIAPGDITTSFVQVTNPVYNTDPLTLKPVFVGYQTNWAPINSPQIGTLAIGSLSMNGGGLNFLLGGASNSVLSITGDINLSGNNTLSFSTNASLTAVTYTFLTWSGAFNGTFTGTNNLPAGYELVQGSNSDYLQYENTNWSSQAAFAGTNAVIVGGSTNFSISLANSGITPLGYSIAPGTNTIGSIGSGTIGAQSTNKISGLSFVSGTNTGVQTGTYTVTTSNASPNVSVGNYNISVYDHASGSFGSSSVTLNSAIVGYTGAISTNVAISNASGFRANLETTSQSTNPTLTLANVSGVAAGTSSNAVLSFAPGQTAGVYSNTIPVVFGDDPSLSGANTNLSTSSVSVAETIYNHASGSLSTNAISLPEVHVGSTSPITAYFGVSNAPGLSVALTATPGVTNASLSVSGVTGLAQGTATNSLVTYVAAQSAGIFTNVVPITFSDSSTLNGASTNLSTANLTISGGAYSGQAFWTNNGRGLWNSLANWDATGGTPGLDGSLSINDTATFGTNGSGSIVLNNNASLSSITFSNSINSYAVIGSGTLTMQTAGIINSQAGSHFIGTALILATNTTSIGSGEIGLEVSVSGPGALFQNGSGVTALTGSNSYTGGTFINSGTLLAVGSNSLGNGNVSINGGCLDIGEGSVVAGAVTLGSGSITGIGSLNAASYSASNGLISIALSGGVLSKSGSGTVTLSGVNSNAGTVISAGTLQVSGGTLGTGTVLNNGSLAFNPNGIILSQGAISGTGVVQQIGSGTTILSGANTYSGGTLISAGTLQVGDGVNNGSLGSGAIVNKGVLAFDPNLSILASNAISGTGGIQQIGSGTTILSGANSYSGGTLISEGTLQVGSGGKSGSLGSGGVIDNGTLTFNLGTLTNFRTAISGSGAFDQIGSGTTILSGSNTYSGGTLISAGTLQVINNSDLGTGALSFGGGVLSTIKAASALSNSISINSGGGTIFNTSAFTLSGNIAGVGGLTKSGGGLLTLGGSNTYSGGTLIGSGTISGNSASLEGNITNNASLVFSQAGAGTFSGGISGRGGVTFKSPSNGSAVFVLVGTNTYSGGTVISGTQIEVVGTTTSLEGNIADGGVLAFNQANAGTYSGKLSGAGRLFIEGGDVTLGGGNTYTGGTLISGGELLGTTATLQGNITNNSVLDFNQTNAGVYAGKLSGSGELIKDGAGTLTLGGINSFSGDTLIDAGTLVGNTTSIHGNIIDDATLVFNQGKNGTDTGSISGTGALIKRGSGALSLGGMNSYTGGTLISSGILSGTTTSLQGNITNRSTLVFNQGVSGTFAGNLSGNGKLNIVGAGNVTLAGSNSLTGKTTISLGTLAASSLGSGPVTISPTKGLTAGFTDTLGSGTLSLGALTLNGGATVTIENAYASIASTGPISIFGTNNFLDLEGSWTSPGTYALLSGAKLQGNGLPSLDLTGSFLGGGLLALGKTTDFDGLAFTFESSSNALDLQISTILQGSIATTKDLIESFPAEPIRAPVETSDIAAVPEPSTWALLIIGALMVAAGYGRKDVLRKEEF